MNHIHQLICTMLAMREPLPIFMPLANDDDTAPESGELTALDNAATGEISATGKLFLPYGEYPHNNGILQKFDNDSAQTMADVLGGQQSNNKLKWLANVFKVGWHRVSKTALPVYAGKHPEVDKDADPAAYGWLKKITPMANGAEFEVEWNDEGRDLIAQKKFRFFSPFWNTSGDGKVQTPVIMESLCLTNRPRIPAAGLGNAADPTEAKAEDDQHETAETQEQEAKEETSEQPEDSALTLITKALNLPEDAPLKDLLMKIQELANKVAGFEQHVAARIDEAVQAANAEKTAAMEGRANAVEALGHLQQEHATALAAEQAATAMAKADLAYAQTQATTLEALANTFRDQLADVHLDRALAAGQITPAMRDDQRAALIACANSADFTAAVEKLHKLPVVMKTTQGHTANAAAGGKLMGLDNSDDKRSLIRTEIERYKGELPASFGDAQKHELAWNRLRKERPDLIGA